MSAAFYLLAILIPDAVLALLLTAVTLALMLLLLTLLPQPVLPTLVVHRRAYRCVSGGLDEKVMTMLKTR